MQIDGVTRAILIPLLTDEDTVVVQGVQLERVRAHRLDGDHWGTTRGDARNRQEEYEAERREVKMAVHTA